jgi:hypothetical protein
MQRAVVNCATMGVLNTTEVSGRVPAESVDPRHPRNRRLLLYSRVTSRTQRIRERPEGTSQGEKPLKLKFPHS